MDIRVGAYGVVVDARGLLLAHWNESGRGRWTLPGGGLDPGEDPADAAVREIREETGYDAALDELLGIESWIMPAAHRPRHSRRGPLHFLQIVYRARILGGTLTDEVGGTTDHAEWVPLDAVDALDRVRLVDAGRRLAGLLRP